jgi:hypothetical protein
MKLYTVNELLQNKESFNGNRVYVEGLLTFETENISINQWPKSEQTGYGIWVQAEKGAFGYNIDSLNKLSGKKVVCLGEFQADLTPRTVDGDFGFGHFSLWPAQIVATELVYYKSWHEANGTSQT